MSKKAKRTTEKRNYPNVERHDVVIPYFADKYTPYGQNLLLTTASIIKNCNTWLGRIIVVGHKPLPELEKKVEYIPCAEEYRHEKDANLINATLKAIHNCEDLTDDFLLAVPNSIVANPCAFGDFKPIALKSYPEDTNYFLQRMRGTPWYTHLFETLRRFPDGAKEFENKMMYPVNISTFVNMAGEFGKYKYEIGHILATLYNNYAEAEITDNREHTYNTIDEHSRFVGFDYRVFGNERFLKKADELFDISEYFGFDFVKANIKMGKNGFFGISQ